MMVCLCFFKCCYLNCMIIVFLSLGSNVQFCCYFYVVVMVLCECFGVLQVLLVYCIVVVGFDGLVFFNNVVVIEIDLLLQELDDWLYVLEDVYGCDCSGLCFFDWILDIDVVFYGDLVVEGFGYLCIFCFELKYVFVLKLLVDIVLDFIDLVSRLDLVMLWCVYVQFGEVFEVVDLE